MGVRHSKITYLAQIMVRGVKCLEKGMVPQARGTMERLEPLVGISTVADVLAAFDNLLSAEFPP